MAVDFVLALWRAPTLLLASAFGFIVGPLLARRLAGVPARKTVFVLACATAGALVGGHLHFMLNYGDVVYGGRPLAALNPWGPLHAGGAVTAMAIVLVISVRRLGLPLGAFADAFAPTFGFSVAIARVGCWLQGCCYGAPSACPWCPTFPPGSSVYLFQTTQNLIPRDAPHSLPAHPLQLYFVGAGIVIGVVALLLQRVKRYDGEVALVSFVLFAASSASIELFRANKPDRVYWGPLPQLEWVALAMTIAGVIALVAVEIGRARGDRAVGLGTPATTP